MKKHRPLALSVLWGLLALPVAAQTGAPSASPKAWGTNETFVTYSPPDFNSTGGAADFNRFLYLQSLSGNNQFALAPHLPTGAMVTSIALEYCDSSASGNHVHLILGDCDETVTPCGALTLVGQIDSTSNGCHLANASTGSYTVGQPNHRLFLETLFDNNDGNIQLRTAMIGYHLQVSPPPGAATFNDVPTSHPFFQYIEALAASGITGGCGSGNYCPDNPLTRGQMAVFLSKALGLYWPN
jgi:hypothetical protein